MDWLKYWNEGDHDHVFSFFFPCLWSRIVTVVCIISHLNNSYLLCIVVLWMEMQACKKKGKPFFRSKTERAYHSVLLPLAGLWLRAAHEKFVGVWLADLAAFWLAGRRTLEDLGRASDVGVSSSYPVWGRSKIAQQMYNIKKHRATQVTAILTC